MSETGFPKPVGEVVATLASIYRHQGRNEILEILENANAFFEQTNYDNWNGGVYTWAFRLEVPVAIYVSIEPQLTAIEQEISTKLKSIARNYPNEHVGEVTIVPIAPGSLVLRQNTAYSDTEIQHIWPNGRFRLFLSHVSQHKTEVSNLKLQLAARGITGFVAHEDIEPSLEWLPEIELGLCTMHALAALVTPDFQSSKWTNQEIGWALGRGILVVPVRLGADPYGFAGKYQGVTGNLEQSAELAESIVQALLSNPQTRSKMRIGIVTAFSGSNSYKQAIALSKQLAVLTGYTDAEKSLLWKACEENSQITRAIGVVTRIKEAIGVPQSDSTLSHN